MVQLCPDDDGEFCVVLEIVLLNCESYLELLNSKSLLQVFYIE